MSDIDISNFVNDYLDNKDDECNNGWDDFDYDAINFYIEYEKYNDYLNAAIVGDKLRITINELLSLGDKDVTITSGNINIPDERYRAWWEKT